MPAVSCSDFRVDQSPGFFGRKTWTSSFMRSHECEVADEASRMSRQSASTLLSIGCRESVWLATVRHADLDRVDERDSCPKCRPILVTGPHIQARLHHGPVEFERQRNRAHRPQDPSR